MHRSKTLRDRPRASTLEKISEKLGDPNTSGADPPQPNMQGGGVPVAPSLYFMKFFLQSTLVRSLRFVKSSKISMKFY